MSDRVYLTIKNDKKELKRLQILNNDECFNEKQLKKLGITPDEEGFFDNKKVSLKNISLILFEYIQEKINENYKEYQFDLYQEIIKNNKNEKTFIKKNAALYNNLFFDYILLMKEIDVYIHFTGEQIKDIECFLSFG